MSDTYSIVAYQAHFLPEVYRPMIFSKWLKSLRYGNPFFKDMDSKAYYDTFHEVIERILAAPKTLVTLAVLTDDNDIVLGFCVSRVPVLEYVHVHRDQRMQGIAKNIMPNEITHFTHMTKMGRILWQKKHKEWKFNPFA